MKSAEFVRALDRLIIARRKAASSDRFEVRSDQSPFTHFEMGVVTSAVEADLAQDLAALGRVRSLARQFISEEE